MRHSVAPLNVLSTAQGSQFVTAKLSEFLSKKPANSHPHHPTSRFLPCHSGSKSFPPSAHPSSRLQAHDVIHRRRKKQLESRYWAIPIRESTLFNALAGLNVRTGNYPGVTIEKVVAVSYPERAVDLVDLPGTYSLAPRSLDELVAVEVLTDHASNEPPVDLIVCVVNALMLQRNLFLVSQLLELGKPIIIVLNMMDSAQSRGVIVNAENLSQALGVPVIPASATKREGLNEVRTEIAKALNSDSKSLEPVSVLPDSFYQITDSFRNELKASPLITTDGENPLASYLSEKYFVSGCYRPAAPPKPVFFSSLERQV